MNKNNILIALSVSFLTASFGFAQTSRTPAQTQPAQTAPKKPAASTAKKKIKLDYENETVMGAYDVPDASFINSRKMIKYKELFNKRTNFIEEIDANKGLFNEY
ncbi:MAG: hypothetical protein K0R29_641 [Pseudobdellovibrio sp.]|nr:hypothetical protein [Pseudobdellovibrio sp.]